MATERLMTCLHLRSKEMYYEDPKELERRGNADAAMYWCECTQTGRGPDDQPANHEACCRRGRTCFVGLEDLA